MVLTDQVTMRMRIANPATGIFTKPRMIADLAMEISMTLIQEETEGIAAIVMEMAVMGSDS